MERIGNSVSEEIGRLRRLAPEQRSAAIRQFPPKQADITEIKSSPELTKKAEVDLVKRAAMAAPERQVDVGMDVSEEMVDSIVETLLKCEFIFPN